jgi:hypothetical protein
MKNNKQDIAVFNLSIPECKYFMVLNKKVLNVICSCLLILTLQGWPHCTVRL